MAAIGWIEKMPDGSKVPYDQRSVYGSPVNSKFWDRKVDADGKLMGESSWPCQKPPWGLLTAVNANTGDIAWQVRLGITDELPEGKQNTGRVNLGGSIATAGGLVFIGATNDRRFRAFDSQDRQGTVGDEARLQRALGADHVSGQERQAVRGRERVGRRSDYRSESQQHRIAVRVRTSLTHVGNKSARLLGGQKPPGRYS